jgi:HlyD family secretion protein
MFKTRSIARFMLYAIFIAALGLTGCAQAASSNASSGNTGVVTSISITDTVQTSGSLTADKLVSLKWSTSGIVEKMNIKVGDKAAINDVLAGLRPDSVPSTIGTAQSDLSTAQRNLQDLLDSATALAQAQLDVITARKAVEVALNNTYALDYARASDTLIKNTQAQIWAAEKTLTLATNKYKEVRNHPDGDPQKTQAVIAMTNAQMAYNNLVITYNWYTGKPTQNDRDQAYAKLDVARAALEDARRKRDNLKAGTDPLQVSAAQAKVTAAQATVNNMYIVAPFDGEIISVQSVVGNSVNTGDLSVEMVDRNTLKVDTLVDDSSISSVSVGNPAAITMDSLPGVTLAGKVIRISRIGAVVNGLVKYTVTVAVDPTKENVLFGTTVNVLITVGQPHSTLAVPVAAVYSDTQGEYVLLVDANGNTSRVTVTSGDLVNSEVTITTKGTLKAGDQVELGSGGSTSGSGGSSGNTRNNGGGGLIGPGAGGPPGG